MAKTLGEYTNEIASSYAGSQGALQKQLDAIEGNLATQQNQINQQYANQQAQLQRNANDAASAASIRAAGNGGSFGGNAAIANQKYYNQTFAPAMLESQTNQSQALENAQTNANDRRTTLEGQLASLQDTIAQSAQQRYYDALEADRQYKLQQQQLAIQKAAQANENAYYKYLMQSAQAAQPKYIGNDDYRGYLNYLSKVNGDMSAATLLDYAGNDGGLSFGGTVYDSNGKPVQLGDANNYYYAQWLQGRS